MGIPSTADPLAWLGVGISDPDTARLIEEGRALLLGLQQAGAGDDPPDVDLDALEDLLARAGDRLPDALTADLMVLRAVALGGTGAIDAALSALDAVISRFGDGETIEVAQIVAFARLTQINLLVNAERVEDACAAAQRLREGFTRVPDGPQLAGFGTMLLDVSFWLLSRERDEEALAICETLITRLADGAPSRQTVAAGARFLAAQASGRLGWMEQSRASIEALCEMGEPALAALDRITTQFGPAEANPTWHAQIVATSVTVLWRLDRAAEAQELARQAAAAFARLEMPSLEAMLQDLAREVGAA